MNAAEPLPQGLELEALLRVEGLHKRFGEVVANEDISFDVRVGEIHCLLGENGAGKSTLTECIFGLYQPDAGRISLRDKALGTGNPQDAIAAGVGMVHQHFVLAEPMTALENIIIGAPGEPLLMDLRQAEEKVRALCARYELELPLHRPIWDLSVGEQQWVEILKSLYLEARLLILDEPTAVLTPQESERLFAILRRMTAAGLAVLLITHKLDEVMQSDRVSVLRKGRLVGTVVTAEATRQSLAHMMVGREVVLATARASQARGPVLLEVSQLQVRHAWGGHAVDGVDFTLHGGEILGLAGVAGNGQNELFEAIVGARKVAAGRVRLGETDITGRPVAEISALGLGHIPDDRYGKGLIGEFSIAENLLLGRQRSPDFARNGFLKRPRITEFAAGCMRQFGILAPGSHTAARRLSGGNAQKIILAREFSQSTCVLLANQPTRGLDVGVIEYVHQQLLEKRAQGYGILLASEELDDLLMLCDRIAVMFKGRLMAVLDAASATRDELGLLMAGQRLA